MISAYSTVSYEAAGMLARVPPIDLLAFKCRSIFMRVREAREEGVPLTENAMLALEQQTNRGSIGCMERSALQSSGPQPAATARLDR